MRGKREKIFDCSYLLEGEDARLVVRAWTPVEAASEVEESVRRAGLPLSGEIVVRAGGGEVLLRVRPRPGAGPAVTGPA